jgi:hypothetical protein
MAHEHNQLSNDREFGRNWVTSSRFMFYMQVLSFLAFVTGCSINMYKSTEYKKKPKVEVQESTLYTPKYKM